MKLLKINKIENNLNTELKEMGVFSAVAGNQLPNQLQKGGQHVTVRIYRNNASERPLGRYDLAGVKIRPGAFTVWSGGRFMKKTFQTFWTRGAIQKRYNSCR